MQWRAEMLPDDGILSGIERFAFLPVRCGDTMVWLENYYEIYKCYRMNTFSLNEVFWKLKSRHTRQEIQAIRDKGDRDE